MAVSPTYNGTAGVAFSVIRHTVFTTLLLARRFRHDQNNDSEFVAPCCFLSSFSVATCIPSMLVSACIRLALKHSTAPPRINRAQLHHGQSKGATHYTPQPWNPQQLTFLMHLHLHFCIASCLHSWARFFRNITLWSCKTKYYPSIAICSPALLEWCALIPAYASPQSKLCWQILGHVHFRNFVYCHIWSWISAIGKFGPARSRYGPALNKNWTGPIRDPGISGLTKVKTLDWWFF